MSIEITPKCDPATKNISNKKKQKDENNWHAPFGLYDDPTSYCTNDNHD